MPQVMTFLIDQKTNGTKNPIDVDSSRMNIVFIQKLVLVFFLFLDIVLDHRRSQRAHKRPLSLLEGVTLDRSINNQAENLFNRSTAVVLSGI